MLSDILLHFGKFSDGTHGTTTPVLVITTGFAISSQNELSLLISPCVDGVDGRELDGVSSPQVSS